MTYDTTLEAPRRNALADTVAALRDIVARNRAYFATKSELARLNARNLADIGLTEDAIERTAREATVG
jgi:uncharacterized protein YjiS (DUF1127 family)